jgi:hypothetical protein
MKGGYRPFKLPPLPPAKLGRDFHENGGPCPRSPQGPGHTTATREIPTLLSLLLQSNPRRRPVKGTLRAPGLSPDDRAFVRCESFCCFGRGRGAMRSRPGVRGKSLHAPL